MPTNYPVSLDTTTELPADQTDSTATDRAGVDHAGEHSNISSAILAIEAELGTAPSGPWSTVKDRVTTVEEYNPTISGTAGRNWLPSGAKMENIPRHYGNIVNQSVLTSGTLRLAPLGLLRNGDSLASVTFWAMTTAALLPTNQWAGIVRRSDRNLLAVSPDATTGAWGMLSTKTFTFDSAYTASADVLLWACLLVAATTTVPSLAGVAGSSTVSSNPDLGGDANTGLTTPLTVGTTITAPTNTSMPIAYCYAS